MGKGRATTTHHQPPLLPIARPRSPKVMPAPKARVRSVSREMLGLPPPQRPAEGLRSVARRRLRCLRFGRLGRLGRWQHPVATQGVSDPATLQSLPHSQGKDAGQGIFEVPGATEATRVSLYERRNCVVVCVIYVWLQSLQSLF
jgi:hypothetical protein